MACKVYVLPRYMVKIAEAEVITPDDQYFNDFEKTF